jgi:putative membrane protein
MIAINLVTILCVFVAALHFYFLYLEMFVWEAPRTRAAFGTTADFARASKTLAANQGLYNGFLAAGIVLALYIGDRPALLFCLACVIVAGVYGAATVGRRILFIQAMPAALALIAVLLKL